MKELARYQKIIDKELEQFFDFSLEEEFLQKSYGFLKEYVLRGGKRLRSIACIKAYEALTGQKNKEIILPSLSLELVHASSLIHDDIMDEDEKRRDKASTHKLFQNYYLKHFPEKEYQGKIFSLQSAKFGTSSGILQGNILFLLASKAFHLSTLSENIKMQALLVLHRWYLEVNEGQQLDLLYEVEDVSEKEYIEMVAKKTGGLFIASLEMGALFAKATEAKRKLFREYGKNLAIAFQISDDLLDITEGKGHDIASDIKQGKKTILMINALKKADEEEKEFLLYMLGNVNGTQKDITTVIEIFQKTKAFHNAGALARFYVEKAKKNLRSLKRYMTTEGYRFFSELTEYVIKRKK
ncbi:polyprenyl synthetase family protein [Candidatus Woesearchaeota archaeon]|nr:polyprenyl synthetase family protein [Candidatus Woesearchaeota archaeon]